MPTDAKRRRYEGNETIARTAYYDRIAHRWHAITGYAGGPLKRYVLNDRVLERIGSITDRAILELGAGNGYFAPLLLRRYSGQIPARLVISDQSPAMLEIARTAFHLDVAQYQQLDVQDPFPCEDDSFDLVLAIMLLNELTASGLANALGECARILAPGGKLLAVVPHPAMVRALARKGVLTDFGRGLFAMPGADGLRLPVSRRPVEGYLAAVTAAGFTVVAEDIYADAKTLREKPGLKLPRATPAALLLDCQMAASI